MTDFLTDFSVPFNVSTPNFATKATGYETYSTHTAYHFSWSHNTCSGADSNVRVRQLYKCWNDVAKPDKVYGNVDGGITNEKVFYDYLTKADPFDDDRCRACLLLPVCAGGCPYARIIDMDKKTNKACPLNVTNLADYLWEHYLCKKSRKG